MLPDFTDLTYLLSGSLQQRIAYNALQSLRIFEILQPYSPVLAGTIPLDIDIPASDLDIICEAHDLAAFAQLVTSAFDHLPAFVTEHSVTNGLPTFLASFTYEGWPIEIFAQPLPVQQQNAYRHMLVEAYLLEAGGIEARNTIRALKQNGLKTEPAFASYFLFDGNPYQALLDYEATLRAANRIKQDLSDVFWIGGSPCSGKSSICNILAARYNLREYSCDGMYSDHLQKAVPGMQPIMSRAVNSNRDEVWMHPVDYLVERERNFYREEFDMVADDLLGLPTGEPVIAEGAALLPECVLPVVANKRNAIWIFPTETFQRATYARREWVQGILSQCSQPAQAWENWMGRDAGFARKIALQAQRLGFAVLEVDGVTSLEENAALVADHFGLSLC